MFKGLNSKQGLWDDFRTLNWREVADNLALVQNQACFTVADLGH